jgi:MerR family copper efflux transcriptional regulator
MNGLTIGSVAKQAQVNIETLRYYERQGIVPKPPRTRSNYRIYPEDTVRRVRFIKRAQELGFSLKEIKELLSLRATRGTTCLDVRQRATTKIKEIDQKILSLQAIQDVLHKLVQQCDARRGSLSECPILESLDSNGQR